MSMSYPTNEQNLTDDDLIQKADKILQEAIANKRESFLFSKKEYSQSDLAKLGQVLPRLGYDVTAIYDWQKKSVLINDLEFVLVHTIYSLIIRYIKLQGKTLTNKSFNKALDEYTQAIRAQVGTMHDPKNRK